MFESITPEQAGISSERIIQFIKKLERIQASMHGILFMKGEKIFAEGYWQPFHKEFCHRQYSQTKSFVGVAIGLLEEEGKLKLTDKIVDYFPEKIDGELPKYLAEQTIEEMLMMTTIGNSSSWFVSQDADRTHHYLNEKRLAKNGTCLAHPSGTRWAYDSPGSQVLCNLVEKLSEKSLLAYLKEKLFNKMGTFKNACVLKAPNGDSWGDSAMICTLRDMASFGQMVMNYGVWNGERLMNEAYLRKATSKLVDNRENDKYTVRANGYGYQIWGMPNNGFAFVGMGDQLTICYPDKEFLFACNSDNQGGALAREVICMEIENIVFDEMQATALPENTEKYAQLQEILNGLRLRAVQGKKDSSLRQRLHGVEYVCEDNPMKIMRFSFHFNDKESGEFRYTNEQGDKTIEFGVNHNVFGKFPQLGYSNEYGGVATTDGFTYNDAVSLAWMDDNKLILFVQIIDKYFGNMNAIFSFKGDYAYAKFSKTAEYFLTEYNGELMARKR